MKKNSLYSKFLSKLKSFLKIKKLPSANQWRQFFKILDIKEKIYLALFSFLFISSFSFLSINFYYKHTRPQPAYNGNFIEGLVGQPRWLNPIYAATNDVDRDIVELIFSGLVKYDQQGKLVPDLAENYKIEKEGKIYQFELRKNVFWHDGKKLTADDVIFTIETVQSPDYKSPFRANWLGVEIEKLSDYELRFKLKKPYAPFLETATLKILPKHIWQEVPSQSFALSPFNLQPIGSGPYKLTETIKDKAGYIKSITLQRNKKYFASLPYISEIKFLFFENEKELIRAARQGIIHGLSLALPRELGLENNFNSYQINIPRYFAVFFNPTKSEILDETEIRYALNYGIDKTKLIKELFGASQNQVEVAQIVDGPLPVTSYSNFAGTQAYQYNLEKAKELLEKKGFKDYNQDGKREKIVKKEKPGAFKSDLKRGSQGSQVQELQKCLAQDSEVYPEKIINGVFGPATQKAVIRFQEKYFEEILAPAGLRKGTGVVGKNTRDKLNDVCGKKETQTIPLKFSLVTAKEPLLVKTAEILKNQWQEIGVEIEIQTFNLSQLEKDVIKKRDYQLLLFGNALGSIPDLFPFWHSSQKQDPGLNLSLYNDKISDKLLEEARESLVPEQRIEKYQKVQERIVEASPAIFLYSPKYIYLVDKKVKGIDLELIVDPSKRFSQIDKWYIKTKRKWK